MSKSKKMLRLSPRQRLELALNSIRNPAVRTKIRMIFGIAMPEAHVFWSANENQIELIADDWEIIVREITRDMRPVSFKEIG